MFGLSIRDRLIKLVSTEVQHYIHIYKDGMLSSLKYFYPKKIPTEEYFIICQKYFDTVANCCFQSIQDISPKYCFRMTQILLNPNQCGYNIDESKILAGAVYAICHYVMTGKVAKEKDCITLNHFQVYIMNTCLDEL